MHKNFKLYSPFLFLFLLLFPIAEKGIHAFEHHDEVHCDITDKHFHEQEHECSICDFTITDSNNLPATEIVFIISEQELTFKALSQSADILFSYSNLPSRAPPAA